jgi:hypothetical protein
LEAQGTRFVEVYSDPETSLFIPQTESPVAASSDNFFEEYSNVVARISQSSKGPLNGVQ